MMSMRREVEQVDAWAQALRGEGGPTMPVPLSLLCGGRPLGSMLRTWAREHASSMTDRGFALEVTTFTDPRTGIALRIEAQVHSDFPAVEWVAHIRNEGPSETPVLSEVQALDAVLVMPPEEPCIVRYSRGSMCSLDDFRLIVRELRPRGELRLQPGGGRSSSEVLPFLNLDLGGKGLVVAIGWTGEWAAHLTREEDGRMRVRAGMDLTRLRLYPGESIRTPRVLVLFWEGEVLRGHNLLRRFILRHHRPRAEGQPLIAPLTCGNWGGTPAEVHLDNIRKIIEHDLPFEYYWIDAEWFGGPGHWMEHAGDWSVREDLYPEGLRPISELLRAHGRKLLLWFEPERVAPGTAWAREHEDWLLEVPAEQAIAWADYGDHLFPEDWARMESRRNQLNRGDRLLNLGHPDALRFLTDFLSECIEEFGIDCFRQDSNIAQLAYWRHADPPDRQGITEIRYIEGQYALWDELLRRHPGLIIDNCSSGGRRVDLESLSRATPLWRTDYVLLSPSRTAQQCHTWGLLHWVPLNGTTCGYLHAISKYELRSAMCSALQAGLWGTGDAQQERIPDGYPFEQARDLLQEYLWVREYFYGDYYPLTEYSQADDCWMAYQLDRPEDGDGLVVVLKRPCSPYTRAAFRLRGMIPEVQYQLRDLDTRRTWTVSGRTLVEEGLPVELPGMPDSALIRYWAEASGGSG